MSEKEKDIAINGILFKIAIIAGCPLPSDERHIKALEVEIKKFMSENDVFANVTFEEILTAFRFNAAGKFEEKVTHYQNMFNLDYLGAVLINWIKYKRNIEARAKKELIRKNLFDLPDLPELTDTQILQQAKAEWDRTKDFMFVYARAYTILKDSNQILLDSVNRACINEQAHTQLRLIYRSYPEVHSYGFGFDVEENGLINILCKKISAAEYFNGSTLLNRDNTKLLMNNNNKFPVTEIKRSIYV